jgi:hypothetical protein
MPDDDLSDGRSREALRQFREAYHRGGTNPEQAYLAGRWIPRPLRSMTFWDFVLACSGAIMLVMLVALWLWGLT